MEWIRRTYGVPAFVGAEVICQDGGKKRKGTIVGTRDCRLLVRLDGEAKTRSYHPTRNIEYIGTREGYQRVDTSRESEMKDCREHEEVEPPLMCGCGRIMDIRGGCPVCDDQHD